MWSENHDKCCLKEAGGAVEGIARSEGGVGGAARRAAEDDDAAGGGQELGGGGEAEAGGGDQGISQDFLEYTKIEFFLKAKAEEIEQIRAVVEAKERETAQLQEEVDVSKQKLEVGLKMKLKQKI